MVRSRALASRRCFELVSWNIFAPVLPGRKPEPAARIISDPQVGQLVACETEIDLLLNDALTRVPDSTVRVEIRRA